MSAIELLYQAALALPPARILIINAQAQPLPESFCKQAKKLDLQQHFKHEYSAINSSGLPVSPDWPTIESEYDIILLLPAKNKQQTYAWMAEAINRLQENGKIIIACANKYGAKSYESALKLLAGNLCSRSKSKCRIFSARRSAMLDNKLSEQWIDAGKPRRIDTHGLMSQPGLFSWDRPDAGSLLLIEQLPSLSGTGMDLCCGYGLLATHILAQASDIKRLHLVETDKFALDCAMQNMASWPDKIQAHWLDASTETLPAGLDWVVCNPPFHSGQSRDIELGQSIVLRACKSLRQGGTLYLVANRKLPYERLLQSELRQCRTLIEADGFKIMQGIR
jgi:16S rRNA (guanine1207-N2)-methyltransferase